jgi:hypothetical protein
LTVGRHAAGQQRTHETQIALSLEVIVLTVALGDAMRTAGEHQGARASSENRLPTVSSAAEAGIGRLGNEFHPVPEWFKPE